MMTYTKLIMLLVDRVDNDRTVIKCNDTSKPTDITIISLEKNTSKVPPIYLVTDLTSAIEAVKTYYE